MTSSAKKIKLNSFDDLFAKSEVQGDITEIELDKLNSFKDHPFKVLDDEKMEMLIESIRANGVLTPILVRGNSEDGYEIISGHRRTHAAIEAGFTKIPAIVKELSDEEATILMVDANIQREKILPSEKAKAYKMKHEALKNYGTAGNTLKMIGEESGENYKTVQRYIRLANLNEELLDMVDQEKLGFRPGVELSYLSAAEQQMVYNILIECKKTLSLNQSTEIKEMSKNGTLDEASVLKLLIIEKKKKREVKLDFKTLDQYFTPEYSSKDIMEVLISLLEERKTRGEEDE